MYYEKNLAKLYINFVDNQRPFLQSIEVTIQRHIRRQMIKMEVYLITGLMCIV